MVEIRVGISGWTYAPWRGIFYPAKMPQKKELHFASRKVSSIEINGTFYRLQKPASFQQWYKDTPDDFRFAIKANNFVTHRRRLKDVEEPLASFFASGILALKDKLGPILWQFPPSLPLVDDRFERFLELLPHSSAAAAALATRHASFLNGKAWLDPGGDYPIRHAFEFRHKSFCDEDFVRLMRKHQVAVVFPDAGEHAPGIDDVTADHVYLRMHGQTAEYLESGYDDGTLTKLASRILAIAAGGVASGPKPLLSDANPAPVQLVSVYFDNDAKALAPLNAMRLIELLNSKVKGE